MRVKIISGGEGGIRTHGTCECTLDFESSPFDHSGTSPEFLFGNFTCLYEEFSSSLAE